MSEVMRGVRLMELIHALGGEDLAPAELDARLLECLRLQRRNEELRRRRKFWSAERSNNPSVGLPGVPGREHNPERQRSRLDTEE
jgi:hypothetical protein